MGEDEGSAPGGLRVDPRPYLPHVKRLLPQLRAFAQQQNVAPVDIDDVVNSAMVSAFTGSPAKPPPPPDDEGRVKAWLFNRMTWAIAAYRAARKRVREQPWRDTADALLIVDPRDRALAIELRSSLEKALDELDMGREQEEVVLAAAIEEVPISEIAKEKGIPYQTAYSQWRRGIQELRGKLTQQESPKNRRRCVLPLFLLDLGDAMGALRRAFERLLVRVKPLRVFANLALSAAVLAFTPGGESYADVEEPQRSGGMAEVTAEALAPVVPAVQGTIPVPETITVPSSMPAPSPQANARPQPKAPAKRPWTPVRAWDVSLDIVVATEIQRGDLHNAKSMLDADVRAGKHAPEEQARSLLRAEVAPGHEKIK